MSVRQKMRMAKLASSAEELNQVLEKGWQPWNKKIIVPSDLEVQQNPRSRSAKLRAATKIETESNVV